MLPMLRMEINGIFDADNVLLLMKNEFYQQLKRLKTANRKTRRDRKKKRRKNIKELIYIRLSGYSNTFF